MKKNLLVFIIGIEMLCIGCTGNQKSYPEQSDTVSTVKKDTIAVNQKILLTEDEAIVQMLVEFYTVYDKVWKEVDSVWLEQIDSLRQKYCTRRLRKKLKELEKQWGGYLEHDILICDILIEYPESLKVTKDNTRDNTYWVSYTAIAGPYPEKEKNSDVQIQIQVVVIEEDGDLKIDDILNPDDCFCGNLSN